MNKEIKQAKEYYNSDINLETYSDAVDKITLWNSENIIFNKYIDKNNKILDLGCGAGRTTINLYKQGFNNIIGLDIADNLIKYAKEYCKNNNLNTKFVVGDASNLEYKDNTFDSVIFSFNGITCIPGSKNRNKVLKEIYRVLKPNGIFIFTAHDRDNSGKYQYIWDEEKIKWENGTQDKNKEMFGDKIVERNGGTAFIHFYNIKEMKEFINQENFKIIDYKLSTDISEENEVTKEFCGETVFWIIQKKEN